MELLSFIKSCSANPAILTQRPVVIFRGQKEYPMLFFAQFFAWAKRHQAMVTTLDLEGDCDDDALRASLQTSFLGNSTVYWLRSISELSDKRLKLWKSYLADYAGPHTLILFTSDESIGDAQCTQHMIVEVPDRLAASALDTLLLLEDELPKGVRVAWRKLVALCSDAVPLDTVYLLGRYALLLGERQEDFTKQWFNALVVNEQSLFTLSQHFFARNASRFFPYWRTVGPEYPEVFWAAYWSDQLWRAFLYNALMHERRAVEAKKCGFRLPFSYLNTDWRLWKPAELADAHAKIYSIDFSLKNGGSPLALELFYSTFLKK